MKSEAADPGSRRRLKAHVSRRRSACSVVETALHTALPGLFGDWRQSHGRQEGNSEPAVEDTERWQGSLPTKMDSPPRHLGEHQAGTVRPLLHFTVSWSPVRSTPLPASARLPTPAEGWQFLESASADSPVFRKSSPAGLSWLAPSCERTRKLWQKPAAPTKTSSHRPESPPRARDSRHERIVPVAGAFDGAEVIGRIECPKPPTDVFVVELRPDGWSEHLRRLVSVGDGERSRPQRNPSLPAGAVGSSPAWSFAASTKDVLQVLTVAASTSSRCKAIFLGEELDR